MDVELKITYLQDVVQGGIQRDNVAMEDLKKKQGFIGVGSSTDFFKESADSAVEDDLVGKICEGTQLTRRTICEILGGIAPATVNQFTPCGQTTYDCVVAFSSIKNRLVLIAKLAVFKLLLTQKARPDVFAVCLGPCRC